MNLAARQFRLLFVVWVVLFSQAWAQITAEEVLRNIERVSAGIKDYTVQLDIRVDLDRLKVPSMQVTMYFKQPEKVHFSSEGFALLPKESIAMGPGQLRSMFTFGAVSDSTEGGTKFYKLELKPKSDESGLRRLYAYIDADRWLIRRMVSPRFDGLTMIAEFHYEEIQGFRLPVELLVRFTSPSSGTADSDQIEQFPPMGRVQMPRSGTLTIRYSNYHVNTGLSDDVFQPPDESKEQ